MQARHGSVLLAVLSLLLLVAGSAQANPYAKYAGTTLVVNFPNIAYYRYVIPTFEESFRDHYLNAVFRKRNGLDGKVSRMEIILPSQ